MRLVDPAPYTPDPLIEGLKHFRAAEPDHEQAVYWFRVAADAEDPEGKAMLALCQLEGLGLPRDPVQARERFESACAAGSLTAQFHLGRILIAGWGGDPDAPRAFALYIAAAAQGHADATFNLASCLDAGWGCQPDKLAAKALFMRARAIGSPLKAPGVRIRQRELDAVRELARRIDRGADLPRLIEERQHEIALIQELAHLPRRKSLLATARRRLLWTTRITALIAGLAAAIAGVFGAHGRKGLAHDSGPTSIA